MIHYSSFDVPFLPLPNVIDVVGDDQLAPYDLTTTSFLIALFPEGSVVMANNCRRGLEFSGGHKDPGESLEDNAIRECFEETGYKVKNVRPIGYQRMMSRGVVPADYKYPHPLSYQQFFVGNVVGSVPYIPNDECHAPVILSPLEAVMKLSSARLALYKLALLAQVK